MTIRRVVTGHDSSSNSVFVSDDNVDPLILDMFPGWEFSLMWGGDEPPVYPDSGRQPSWSTYFPSVGGFRFSFSTIPPEEFEPSTVHDEKAAADEAERALPGLMSHLETENPGMHTTDTVDFEVVLRGNIYLQLDHGVEKLLRPGDTVIQNGTRHRWRNPGPEPVFLAVFMVGANRLPEVATRVEN